MNNIAVSGYVGFGNFGDEAIFCALSKHLKNLGYNVCVFCNNPEKTALDYDVKTCFFKSPAGIIKTIFKSDILISGGGSLLQNKTSNFSLFYYLFIILLAKLMFKKVIIFSQGFEPIRGFFPSFITKSVLKTVDFISVRDKKSLDLLANYKIKANLTSDPVYSLLENIKPEENKNGLLIQLRQVDKLNENFISDLAYSISKLNIDKIGVFSFQEEYDKEICEKFIYELSKYKKNANLITNKNVYETIDIINSFKYIISMRLHGLITANALKTSCFALIYDEKINTLCEEIKIENINVFNYSKEELNTKIENFINTEEIKYENYRKYDWQALNNYLKSIREKKID